MIAPLRYFRRVLQSLTLCGLCLIASAGQAAHSNALDSEHFHFETYFQGAIHARGFVYNRGGDVIRRFWAEIEGTWNADTQTLTLDEILHFDDGESLNRVWHIERLSENRYLGRANDVDGDALGETSEFDGVLRYALNLNFKGFDLVVNVDDRFHVISDDVLFNKTRLTKFGFYAGSVATVFYKGDAVPHK